MDRIIATHKCHSPRKEPEWERTRARALFLSYEITQPPSSDGPRTRVNLSLSLFLFRARRSFEREMINTHKKRDTKKVRGSGKESTRENTILSSSFQKRERERYIFCSDDDEDVPVGKNVFVHILRSTLRQIDVRALLLHFLSPGLKYEEEETKDGSLVSVCCWFSFLCNQNFLAFCVFRFLLRRSLGGKGSSFHAWLLVVN